MSNCELMKARRLSATEKWSGDESPRRMTFILYLFVWLQVAPVWYTVPCLLDLFHLLARWILQH